MGNRKFVHKSFVMIKKQISMISNSGIYFYTHKSSAKSDNTNDERLSSTFFFSIKSSKNTEGIS
ncbi:hypothetical protein Ahy_A04g017868 isoform B [Arachis hypogaea]|uniref:Uncharacterized protein n=1 Tax=Arachis hypogaea TaxID=3818 RepID=A0A445DCC4_ARAHY|nr:hypothetical protein Ahy_A04g017868 isoform B [Arachis hypogaea]